MERKKTPNFFLVIIVIIIGSALYKQVDFENLTIEKPLLALVYIATLVFSIYLIIKDYRKPPKE